MKIIDQRNGNSLSSLELTRNTSFYYIQLTDMLCIVLSCPLRVDAPSKLASATIIFHSILENLAFTKVFVFARDSLRGNTCLPFVETQFLETALCTGVLLCS